MTLQGPASVSGLISPFCCWPSADILRALLVEFAVGATPSFPLAYSSPPPAIHSAHILGAEGRVCVTNSWRFLLSTALNYKVCYTQDLVVW